jgi:ribonuclease E
VREQSREPRRDRSPSDGARAEGRTRDVEEDRTPADLEQSKRRPRRDRASVARNQGDERRPAPTAEPVESVAETATPLLATAEAVEAELPVQVAEDAPSFGSEPEAAIQSAPIEDAPRPKPAPAVVVLSPIEVAAEAVKQEPERPAGRAANDPREVRKREREARLRQEGVIGERSPE